MDRRRLLRGTAAVTVAGLLMPPGRAEATPSRAKPGNTASLGARAETDYPLAQWLPAATSNYTASSRPSSYSVDYVVIHVAQETFADTVRIFQNPAKKVSAHYVVRSTDGHVAQCVRERHVGWHAGNWDYNTRSVGIEHEGWVDQPVYFTDVLYERSAALTASICARYGIPRTRSRIIGHHEVPGADHTDPGRHWDWTRYMRLVNSF
ncbi:N-acetylmuramoyl-L-alanine amidase [Streptomyces sp. NPDC057638]|uniref:N-acetylmuramoyl-L-alanine amidase n=1 Tax=Streptomyces sp. NPDC057638 TaxID=3346190 RepID=UPI003673CF57